MTMNPIGGGDWRSSQISTLVLNHGRERRICALVARDTGPVTPIRRDLREGTRAAIHSVGLGVRKDDEATDAYAVGELCSVSFDALEVEQKAA
jgi:hypothetical protein